MIEQIRPNALAAWLQSQQGDKPVVVLDVREPAEWRTASVKENDFTLVQMSMGTVPARVQELDAQLPIAILCHHGGRSMQVAQFLASRGFAQVANIAGGIDAWAMEIDNSIPRY